MGRRAKSPKDKANGKGAHAQKPQQGEDAARIRDLEERLTESLEREKASGEILRVISSSPASVQPTFEAIARAAMSLCEADIGSLFRFDGQLIHVGAFHGTPAETEASRRAFPQRPSHRSVTARAILAATVVQIDDVSKDPEAADALRAFRTVLSVPMIRDGRPLGAITVARRVVRPFSDEQIELLKTFADQAVIAIENVRLFKELEEKNRALTTAHAQVTESLEQQTATSEILGVISRSPTDVQPVFDTIVDSAAKLCDAFYSALGTFDGELMDIVAAHNWTPAAWETARRIWPSPPSRALASGRAILDRAVVHVPDVEVDPEYASPEMSRTVGFRSILALPMIRDGEPVGVIAVGRAASGRFSDSQVALLKTFADQAVIAIENVRLFKELEERNRALTEALEQQTATSGILRVLAGSPTNIQPVLATVAASAARLCDASDTTIFQVDRNALCLVEHAGPIPSYLIGQGPTMIRGTPVGRAVLDGRAIHVLDLQAEVDEYPEGSQIARRLGHRTVLVVPMLQAGRATGAIAIRRTEVRPFTDTQIALLQTFADQAIIAIENVRLFTETKEALEQQTATSEILQVISGSPTSLQPVLDAIAANAARVCGAHDATVLLREGDFTRRVAHHGPILNAVQDVRPLSGRFASSQAIREGRPVHVHDIRTTHRQDVADAREASQQSGYRTLLSVPMLREGEAIGALTIRRLEVQPFTDKQIALLKTFADQAVIAIENVRLFTELQTSNRDLVRALDKQTATSDILAVISRSQTDVRPVFDAILASAVRLLGAHHGVLARVVGDQMELAASTLPGGAEEPAVRAAAVEGSHAQAIRERAPVNIADMQTDPQVSEGRRALARAHGYRSLATVPLLRQQEALGAIAVARPEPGGFVDDEIALLKTFADQAVIAIENVRLFTELQARNRDLTATSEILGVISRSPTEVQPVFDTIVDSAAKLCDAVYSALATFDGELLDIVAAHNWTPAAWDAARRAFPAPPSRAVSTGRAILDRAVVHVPDVEVDPEYDSPELSRSLGFRSLLAVPMIRDGEPVGVIGVGRATPGPFSDSQVALLKTFADQAVIAIENVRLFTELQQKNEALTQAHGHVSESLEQQTATSELLKVIGRSTFDLQPVFETLAENAVRLCEAERAFIWRPDGEVLRAVVTYNATPALREVAERNPIAPGRNSGTARAALERRTVHIPDALADLEYTFGARDVDPIRTVLAIPMLRAEELLGVIAIYRLEVRPFTDSQVALMETFADQAVIAIENARLLSELQTRTAELTRSVGELTALGEVGRALSSTLDLETVLQTIVLRANELAGTAGCTIWEYDEAGEQFRLRVSHYTDESDTALLRALGQMATIPKGPGVTTQVVERRQPVQIPDITAAGAYEHPIRGPLIEAGHRALLGVPLLSEDEVIGVLTVTRKAPGEFPPETVRLLQTFATQSALAIQNARLFLEIEDKSRQLEVASRHKSEFLASMSHELRTPLNGILGFNEMILDDVYGEVPPELREPLTEIQNSGRHLLRLINNVLDLSKIEAGRMELALGDYAVQDTVAQVRASLHSLAADKGLEFVTAVPTDLPLAYGDAGRIAQCLTNLAGNAIKFTRQGRVEIAVELQGELLVYRVSDTGIGIPSDRIDTLFTEFRQADATIASEFGGSGLGLSITRKFAEMHGGRVWVESEPGKGSKFFLAVPLRLGGGAPA